MPDERDLTPEQEARVARLLADARAEGPIPPEVGARLDRVLEGMKDESVGRPGRQPAPVIDLAARRRRRAATLLAAAAAVVVAGVGIGQVVGPDRDGDEADSSAVDEGSGGANDEAQRAQPSARGDAPMSKRELEALGTPARISTKTFAGAVRRLQGHAGVISSASAGTMMDGAHLAAPSENFSCSAADYGEGKLMAVYYNGRPSVLAYRPTSGDTQVVELLQCGSGEPIRSTTIPLP